MADHAAERVTLSPRQQELKAACAALMDGFGGAIAAGAHFGRGHQRFCEMVNPTHPSWMTIAQVAELESCTVGLPGHPHVTRLLARRAGFVLVERAAAEGGGCVMTGLAAVQAELGDVARVVIEATKDGELDQAERKTALDQLAEVEARAASLRVLLEGETRA